MKVAIDKFVALIQGAHLTSMQEEYLRNIIRYVCENGDIKHATMQNEPFREYDWQGVFRERVNLVPKYIKELHEVISAG